MIESYELPLAREYKEELDEPPGEEMCRCLLKEIKVPDYAGRGG